MNLRVFVATFLFRGDFVLLLRRARTAGFAPGKWTGVGGRVDPGELDRLEAAALREIREETGLGGTDLLDLRLRFILTRPEDEGVSVLAFCTATTDRTDVGPCDEGDLQWVPVDDLAGIDMIDNARRVLESLLNERSSPKPSTGIQYAVCRCDERGRVVDWAALS